MTAYHPPTQGAARPLTTAERQAKRHARLLATRTACREVYELLATHEPADVEAARQILRHALEITE